MQLFPTMEDLYITASILVFLGYWLQHREVWLRNLEVLENVSLVTLSSGTNIDCYDQLSLPLSLKPSRTFGNVQYWRVW